MPQIIDLTTFTDQRGYLTVIENILPFSINRIYYIYGVNNSKRGNHRHKETTQAAIAISGNCNIYIQASAYSEIEVITLNSPSKCLIIMPTDYHWMDSFSSDCVLLVLASHNYDPDDYIFEPY